MTEAMPQMPAELVTFLREPRLVQLTTLDPAGAPFVNVISWVLAHSAGHVRLVGDTRTQFMQNIRSDGRVALTVYGAGSAWTIYGTATVVAHGLPGLPPTFALVEVTGLQVFSVLFLGATLTQEPLWATSAPEAAEFDRRVYEVMQ
ncbi:MAG TPA: pyridoxamine 5'-phosphate oxidase family protein [Symbiobacteriaceae bacterium]|nr:pyridoxamine 5'-phosphate oxidase family protein [Symbiobacteriaceae bacterium]